MEPMTILTTITAALQAVDKGAQLAQRLSGAKDDKLADHREQLVEMRGALLEAKNALLDSQSALKQQEQEVVRLKEAFETRHKVRRVSDAVYSVGEDGEPHGDAYCLRCYQEDQRLRHLVRHSRHPRISTCTVCHEEYQARNTFLPRG